MIENLLDKQLPKYTLYHETRDFKTLISFDAFEQMAEYLSHREDYKTNKIRIMRL